MSNQQRGRAKPATKEVKRAEKDLRRFLGKHQRTDFSFLKEVDPKKFGDKVFRLITDDASHDNVSEKMYLGWEVVTITKEDSKRSPLLGRFLLDKETDEGATIKIPVNPHNPNMGLYGILMMKSRRAYQEEEREALNQEVRRTEVGLRRGQDQAGSGADGEAFYAPNVDEHGTKGFKQEGKESLL